MRVALDGLPLQVRSAGIAVYTRELIGALAAQPDAPQLSLFTCTGLPAPAPSAATARGSILYPLIMGAPLHGLPRLLSLDAALHDVDLFHATNYAVPRTRLPLVLTVHDLALLRHPELGTPALRRMVGRVGEAWPAARLVIADSAATAHDLHELLGVPTERVRVIYPGCTAQFRSPPDATDAEVLARHQLAEPYILHVGTFEPRKNLVRLVYAYARATAERRDPPLLVLVGGAGWGEGDPSAAIAATDCGARVRRLHGVPTADLPALYRAAHLFAYPSLYEGFGLPVLEALACGAPVVTSTASSLPEVAGDAALLVEPRDQTALADALIRLLDDDDLRRELAARGPARAAPFTWARCAAETLAVYREALGG